MKKLSVVFAMLVLLAIMAQMGLAQAAGSDDETVAAITKIERDWEKAMQNKDDAGLAKLLADNWVGLNPDGSMDDKGKLLSQVKNGDLQNAKLETIDVKSFGNTAVAMGKASDPKMGNVVYMDVFMKMGGAWKAVASQVGSLQQAK